jgi:excisionase family DNA binding protein
MPSPDTAFDLLSMSEVAILLKCSKAHVCNAVAGRVRGCQPIPSVRLGRRTLIRRSSLLSWIEQNELANDNLESSPKGSVPKHASRRLNA